MGQKQKKKPLKTIARFSGLGLQMGLTIYLGHLLGEWLDNKFQSKDDLYHKICTLGAVFASVASVILQVNKFSKDS